MTWRTPATYSNHPILSYDGRWGRLIDPVTSKRIGYVSISATDLHPSAGGCLWWRRWSDPQPWVTIEMVWVPWKAHRWSISPEQCGEAVARWEGDRFTLQREDGSSQLLNVDWGHEDAAARTARVRRIRSGPRVDEEASRRRVGETSLA